MTDTNDKKSPVGKIVGAVVALMIAAGAFFFWQGSQAPEIVLSEDEIMEASAPAIAGAPQLTIYFEPSLAGQAGLDRAEVPPGDRAAVVELAELAKSSPNKIVLVTAYYNEALDPKNDLEYARLRGKSVRFAIAGEGLQNERVLRSKPVALSEGSAREANRVEVRLQ